MQIKPIDQAPHDGSLQLVMCELAEYGPFFRCRFLHGLWIAEGTGNGSVEGAVAWLDLTPEPT